MTTVPTTSFHNHRCLNTVPTLLFHKLALCKTAAQHSGSPIWSSGIIAHPNLTDYLRAILCFLLLSQPVTAYHTLADCIACWDPTIQLSKIFNVAFLYLGLLSRKLWGVGNFHRLWPVGLPPDRILPRILHRTWGPHPYLAGTLNTIHANHFEGPLGNRFREIRRHFLPAARLWCWRNSAGCTPAAPSSSSTALRSP